MKQWEDEQKLKQQEEIRNQKKLMKKEENDRKRKMKMENLSERLH